MELLIVIGVLGILAVGLLAAIDPFEQLKKARDTNNRNAATELLQANQRYYATHGYLPWFKQTVSGTSSTYDCAVTTDGTSLDLLRPATPATAYPLSAVLVNKTGSTDHDTDVENCITDTLGADGEVKDTFFDGLSTTLYLTSGSPTRVAVCFSPEAKSNRTDPSTKFYWNNTTGQVLDAVPEGSTFTCPDPSANEANCLQCFQ